MIAKFTTRYIPMVGYKVVLWMEDDSFQLCRRNFASEDKAWRYGYRLMKRCETS